MKHKVIIFQTHLPTGNGGGIKVYCDAVRDLFIDDNDFNIIVCPILPHSTILGYKFDMSQITKYVDEENPDIIHINGYAHLLVSQLVPFAKKRNIKIAYTPHWHPFSTMRKSFLKKCHFYLFVRPYLKDMDAIININNEEATFFKKYTTKTNLIPHWNLGKVKFDPTITKKPNMILFVGNLFYKNKGFDYLLKLPEGKYDIHCVGRGSVNLRSDITQHQNIPIEELNKLYNKASLVVIPSHYEAFSYTALEAFTCNTPIVVSNNVRFTDFIPVCQQCSIFEYGDYSDFVKKVEETIGAKFNSETIIAKFSPIKAKQDYKALYTKLINNKISE